MEWTTFESIVKNIGIFASIVGLLVGLDLLVGAKVTTALRKTLDRKLIDFDKAVTSNKTRFVLGVLYVILAVVIILLIKF
jgi:hypothetical protein